MSRFNRGSKDYRELTRDEEKAIANNPWYTPEFATSLPNTEIQSRVEQIDKVARRAGKIMREDDEISTEDALEQARTELRKEARAARKAAKA